MIEDIRAIRALSGLSWAEMGETFGVSHRTVHNWVRGESVSPEHGVRIQELLARMSIIDQGSALATASFLRKRYGEGQLYSVLGSIQLSELKQLSIEFRKPKEFVVDQATLMANWRPVAPFWDRWDDQPIEEVVPIGDYPAKRLKVAAKRPD